MFGVKPQDILWIRPVSQQLFSQCCSQMYTQHTSILAYYYIYSYTIKILYIQYIQNKRGQRGRFLVFLGRCLILTLRHNKLIIQKMNISFWLSPNIFICSSVSNGVTIMSFHLLISPPPYISALSLLSLCLGFTKYLSHQYFPTLIKHRICSKRTWVKKNAALILLFYKCCWSQGSGHSYVKSRPTLEDPSSILLLQTF